MSKLGMILNGFSVNKIVAGAILLVEHLQDFKDSWSSLEPFEF